MSLLLDALKKAAEQKARKSKSESPIERASDETLVELDAERAAAAAASAAGRSDETELDHSEINARLERGSVVRGGGDDTGLDLTESTDMSAFRRSLPAGDDTNLDLTESTDMSAFRRSRPGGDDTGIDLTESTDISVRQDRSADDQTRLDLSDSTDTRIEQNHSPNTEVDDTGLDITQADEGTRVDLSAQLETGDDETIVPESGDATEFAVEPDLAMADGALAEDETDLSRLDVQGDSTGIGKPPAEGVEVATDDADQTDLRESAGDADRALSGDHSTESRQPATDPEQADADEPGAEPHFERGAFDEDLSLLLLEPDPTSPRTADTAFNKPQVAAETGNDFAADADALALVETTQSATGARQPDAEGPTLTSPSETLYADESSTVRAATARGNAAHGDPTSTRTYAPDNYDRTLMKLPSNDASKLFAGMKSESDVVMTPDYAKKVFRSKTSAQRAQHYKLYGATAFVIVLAIGIFGVFQYQDESLEIDNSLRLLKRDPMPGLIKTPKPEESSLFAGSDSETTARTIEIIETAETVEPVETGEPSPESTQAIAITAPVTTAPQETTAMVESAPAASRQAAVPQGQVAQGDNLEPISAPDEPQADPVVKPVESSQVASLSSPETQQPLARQPADSARNLKIESSNQYLQSDVWLREAYEAYSAGDDQRALRLYNKVLDADPGNRNALLARAAINIQNGDIEAAIRDYQELLLQNPKDSLAMASLLAVTSFSPLETESQLKLMLYDEPDSPFLNFALANSYGEQDRWHEAQQHYFKALQNNPRDPNYAYNLAVSLEHIAQPASAVTYYRRALENFDSGLATFNREIVIQRLEKLENL